MPEDSTTDMARWDRIGITDRVGIALRPELKGFPRGPAYDAVGDDSASDLRVYEHQGHPWRYLARVDGLHDEQRPFGIRGSHAFALNRLELPTPEPGPHKERRYRKQYNDAEHAEAGSCPPKLAHWAADYAAVAPSNAKRHVALSVCATRTFESGVSVGYSAVISRHAT